MSNKQKSKLEKDTKYALERGFRLVQRSDKRGYYYYTCITCKHECHLSSNAVRWGAVACQGCRLNNIKTKAYERGFDLLDTSTRVKRKLYKCKTCGEEKRCPDVTAIQGKLVCIPCKKAKRELDRMEERLAIKEEKARIASTRPPDRRLVEAAKEQGFKILGAGKDRLHRTYRCMTCFGICEKPISGMKAGKVKCGHCFLKKLQGEAEACGFKLIGEGSSCRTRLYSCVTCKRESEKELTSIRAKTTRCRGCKIDKLQIAANAHGFELEIPDQKGERRGFRCLSCKEVTNAFVSSITNGSIVCKTCSSSHWDKPSSFYVNIMCNDGFKDKSWIKIGVAYDVKRRIEAYGLDRSTTVDTVETTRCKDRFVSTAEFEKPLKDLISRFQYDKEDMRAFMKNGHTECYHIDSLQIIMDFLCSKLTEKPMEDGEYEIIEK